MSSLCCRGWARVILSPGISTPTRSSPELSIAAHCCGSPGGAYGAYRRPHIFDPHGRISQHFQLEMAGQQRMTSYALYLRPPGDSMPLVRPGSAGALHSRIQRLRAKPPSIYLRHGGKLDMSGLGGTANGAHRAAGLGHGVIAEADCTACAEPQESTGTTFLWILASWRAGESAPRVTVAALRDPLCLSARHLPPRPQSGLDCAPMCCPPVGQNAVLALVAWDQPEDRPGIGYHFQVAAVRRVPQRWPPLDRGHLEPQRRLAQQRALTIWHSEKER